jgi:group I intron endonuclease
VNSGIYCIRNQVTGDDYIGSSADLRGRKQNHRSLLNRGTHQSAALRAAVTAFGPEAFIFKVLEECLPDKLLERERDWIERRKPAYNRLMPTSRAENAAHQITVRIDAARLEELEAAGKAMKPLPLNRSEMIAVAVADYLERHGRRKAGK